MALNDLVFKVVYDRGRQSGQVLQRQAGSAKLIIAGSEAIGIADRSESYLLAAGIFI